MIGDLKTIVLDAPDIAGLSAFYTGWRAGPQRYADDEWVTMTTDDGWRIGFQHAPDHVPPRWPDPAHPQQAHLDLRVPDLEAGDRTRRRARRDACCGSNETLAHPGRPGRAPVRPLPQGRRPEHHADGRHARLPRRQGAERVLRRAARQAGHLRGRGRGDDRRGRRAAGAVPAGRGLHRRRAGRIRPIRSSCTSTSWSTTSRRPSRRRWRSARRRLPGEGENWRVYADPAGKPFCLLWSVE